MNLSRRDKIAVSLLGLAGVALAVDRLILPPPADALGAQVGADLVSSRSIDEILADMPSSLPQRDFAADSIPDVFDVARVEAVRLVAERPPADALAQAMAADFQRRHRLTAVVLGPHPVALVGQVPVQIGDELDGHTLVEVSESAALFVSDTGPVTLTLTPVRNSP
jgi:hypothetical protein